MYKISENGVNFIKGFEGFSSKPYLDVIGVCTIGYGTTIYPNGVKISIKDKIIPERVAIEYLKYDLEKFEKGVVSLIGNTKLNQNQFDALVSFAYNCGLGNLKTSTLLKIVKAMPTSEAIFNQFLRWNKAGGKEISGLTRRRKAEAELYYSN
jgi:lysozyme